MGNFLVGAATSAHQVEGYNTNADCWIMENAPGTMWKEPSGAGVDHYNRFREDIDYLADEGLNTYRFTIEWARVQPEEGKFEEGAFKHYQEVIEYCIEKGVVPIVTLHHFSTPAWVIKKGGWKSETTVIDFAAYCRAVMQRLGEKLTYVCTINEANMGLQMMKVMQQYAEAAQREGADNSIQIGMNIPGSCFTYFGEAELLDVLFERLRKHSFCAGLRTVAASFETSNIAVINVSGLDGGQYEMDISEKRVVIRAAEKEDICMALTTLYWMLREGNGNCRCGVVKDAPLFRHRGVLMDSCRHFFPVEDMKQILEQLALRKINRIHWHLSDDQGYRIESRKFPKLNTVGSWWKESDNKVYGGYYTREQIEDIVRYTYVRGIEIIPEIDMPGHTSAIISAFPELSCSEEPLQITGQPGVYDRILCAGKDSVIQFLYELLDEVCEMFPSNQFHIGGDEAPKKAWQSCKLCQKRIAKNNLEGEEELQAWLTRKIAGHLQKKGKTVICWNEAAKSKALSKDVVIQYWDEEGEGENYCSDNLKEGQKLIYSYSPYFYFDYIHAMLPIRMPIGCEIKYRSGELIDESKILGLEATLWSEQIPDIDQMERMAFPRVLALAERAWSGKTAFSEFMERCRQELAYLKQDGIFYTPLKESDLYGEEQNEGIIQQWEQTIKAIRAYGMKELESTLYRFVDIKLREVYRQREDELQNIKNRLFG